MCERIIAQEKVEVRNEGIKPGVKGAIVVGRSSEVDLRFVFMSVVAPGTAGITVELMQENKPKT